MRNQNLPPIKYMDNEPYRVREVEIRYSDEAITAAKAAVAEAEDAATLARFRELQQEKEEAALFGEGLKGRTIGAEEEL